MIGPRATSGLPEELAGGHLPEGWVFAPLRDIATSRKGKRPSRLTQVSPDGAVPYIDIAAFETGLARQYAEPEASVLVEQGDLLVVWDGARCGLAGMAPKRGALGSTLAVLKPTGVEASYLFHFLRSQYEVLNSSPRGSGITHIDPELFWGLEVPIPPLTEQTRMVERLESLHARINGLREHLAKAPVVLARFRHAVLMAACSGRLTADWRYRQLHLEPATTLFDRISRERGRVHASEKIRPKSGQTPQYGNCLKSGLGFRSEICCTVLVRLPMECCSLDRTSHSECPWYEWAISKMGGSSTTN